MIEIFIIIIIVIFFLTIILYKVYLPGYKKSRQYVQFYSDNDKNRIREDLDKKRKKMEQLRKYRHRENIPEEAKYDGLFNENFENDKNKEKKAEEQKLRELRKKMRKTKGKSNEIELSPDYFTGNKIDTENTKIIGSTENNEKKELKDTLIGRNVLKQANDKKIEKIRARAARFQQEYENKVNLASAGAEEDKQEEGEEQTTQTEQFHSIYQQDINTSISSKENEEEENTGTKEGYDDYLDKRRSEIPSFTVEENREEEEKQEEQTPQTEPVEQNFAFLENNTDSAGIGENKQQQQQPETTADEPKEDSEPVNNDTQNLFYKSMGYEAKNNEADKENTKDNNKDETIPSAFSQDGPLSHEDSDMTKDDIDEESKEDKKKKKENKEQDFEPTGLFDF